MKDKTKANNSKPLSSAAAREFVEEFFLEQGFGEATARMKANDLMILLVQKAYAFAIKKEKISLNKK